MGMADYLEGFRGLGMDHYQMFNAQGNSFDRAAVALRVRGGWQLGCQVA